MSIDTNGSVSRQSSSYRQGLVLGLTMAEIMILLIFCLLIAIAALLKSEQSKSAGREESKTQEWQLSPEERSLADALSKTPVLAEKLKSIGQASPPGKVDEFWRELVEAAAAVASLKPDGLSTAQIAKKIEDIKALASKGLSAEAALQNAELTGAITGAMTKANEVAKSPRDVADLVERGIAAKRSTGHKWPPIISLSEAQGYHFKSGSAELSTEFRKTLVETVPSRILELIKEYDVDVVEVVGHTDQQPLGQKQSNLDRDLLSVLKNDANIASLIPADNAGLGLARAVSVVSVLLKSPILKDYKLIPMSGAQLVNNDETLATSNVAADVAERRRIEIRLRKSSQQNIAARPDAARIENVPHPPRRPRLTPQPPQAPASPQAVPWMTNPFRATAPN